MPGFPVVSRLTAIFPRRHGLSGRKLLKNTIHGAPAPSRGPSASTATHRAAWTERRIDMEAGRLKHTPTGVRRIQYWPFFEHLVHVFAVGLRVIGLYARGYRNALDIQVTELEFEMPELPKAFDGYRILQLTDLHIGRFDEIIAAAIERVRDVQADLCVLTGDYLWGVGGPFQHVLPVMAKLREAANAADGICATLGNHDCHELVPMLEGLGIRVLLNETVAVERSGEKIYLTGLDDVHYFYTDAAHRALLESPDGFKIALVHSPEVADWAAAAGYSAYLTGHTHGGQICFPGGHPLITHVHRCRAYASGLWRCSEMHGYTSTGTGVSAIPIRFNTRGEIVLIRLRRGSRQRSRYLNGSLKELGRSAAGR
jgi:predicted MPP superfamily phosphohydrolase